MAAAASTADDDDETVEFEIEIVESSSSISESFDSQGADEIFADLVAEGAPNASEQADTITATSTMIAGGDAGIEHLQPKMAVVNQEPGKRVQQQPAPRQESQHFSHKAASMGHETDTQRELPANGVEIVGGERFETGGAAAAAATAKGEADKRLRDEEGVRDEQQVGTVAEENEHEKEEEEEEETGVESFQSTDKHPSQADAIEIAADATSIAAVDRHPQAALERKIPAETHHASQKEHQPMVEANEHNNIESHSQTTVINTAKQHDNADLIAETEAEAEADAKTETETETETETTTAAPSPTAASGRNDFAYNENTPKESDNADNLGSPNQSEANDDSGAASAKAAGAGLGEQPEPAGDIAGAGDGHSCRLDGGDNVIAGSDHDNAVGDQLLNMQKVAEPGADGAPAAPGPESKPVEVSGEQVLAGTGDEASSDAAAATAAASAEPEAEAAAEAEVSAAIEGPQQQQQVDDEPASEAKPPQAVNNLAAPAAPAEELFYDATETTGAHTSSVAPCETTAAERAPSPAQSPPEISIVQVTAAAAAATATAPAPAPAPAGRRPTLTGEEAPPSQASSRRSSAAWRADELELELEFDNEPPFAAAQVTVKCNMNPRDEYELGAELGRGKFGTVYKCCERATGRQLAAKFVSMRRREDRQDVEREVAIMSRLQHRRLLQLYDAFDDTTKNEMCLVTELIEGGELFERVVDDDFELTERKAAIFMRQICEGVEYMHSKGIVHLDLKPENCLCVSRTGCKIKLIDFGLARELKPGDPPLRVMFGTPDFAAPEVLAYDTISLNTDMWSVGVICYVLLSGLSPFMGDSDMETMANVTRATYDFNDSSFEPITEIAKDFISRLLVREQALRMTPGDCLRHAWLAKPRPGELAAPAVPGLKVRRESIVALRNAAAQATAEQRAALGGALAELMPDQVAALAALAAGGGGDGPAAEPMPLQLNKANLKRYVVKRKWHKAAHAIRALARMRANLTRAADFLPAPAATATTTNATTTAATPEPAPDQQSPTQQQQQHQQQQQ